MSSEKVQYLFRRIQGELVLLDKQQAHFTSLVTEFTNCVSLLLSIRSGALIRNDCNLLSVENKVAALYYRAHEFVTDVLSTCISLVKLLTDLIEANKIAGLEVLMKEAIELVNLRKLSIERSLQMMRIKDNSLESIHKQIIILRYPPEPDMTIPLEAYGFSVNK